RCSATAVFPVPGPPWTTSTPLFGALMIQSCSTWIVSTMSVIWPVRLALSAASRAASPFSPLVWPFSPGAARSSTSSSRRGALRLEVARPPHALRRDRRSQVERPGGGSTPVQQQGPVVGVLVTDAKPPDVVLLAAVGVDPAEAESVLRRVELRQPLGVHADQD